MRTLILILLLLGVVPSLGVAQSSAPDRDGDGISDSDDACPDRAGIASTNPRTQGCPSDQDLDGIVDSLDACPKDPGPASNDPRKTGCPSSDNDGDGILDRHDKCPNEPEDKDGFEDEDGCPDPDNDGDGVSDASDKCPNESETKNGFQDQDGCRDELPRALVGRTTPHPGFPDWVPPNGLPSTPSITSKRPPPGAAPIVPAIGRTPVPPAGTPSSPSGYRCGTGGTLVVNRGCKCPAGRVERRDADDVALCDKGGDPAKAASGPTAPAPPTSPATAMGKLVIIAKPTITPGPSWATVQIDGRPVGETPVTTNLAAGSHIIAFTRGTTHRTLKVSVKAAETTKVTLELE